MKLDISRRDFLKLASLLSLLPLAGSPAPLKRPFSQDGREFPNVLFLVFDTLSARHLSLHGYPRQTSPNIDRFAEKAHVFHAHYAGGNFTSPGTASLLTGTYPWTHRAFHLTGSVRDRFVHQNIFQSFSEGGYHNFAYTHNQLANVYLDQFRKYIHQLIPPDTLYHWDSHLFDEKIFANDPVAAYWAETGYKGMLGDRPTSLFFSQITSLINAARWKSTFRDYKDRFPRGIPGLPRAFFFLEEAIDWTVEQVNNLPQPYFSYIHLLPPHDPYNTRHEFIGAFNDDWQPVVKPKHFFTMGHNPKQLALFQRHYDEYIAYTDSEFGRLYDAMETAGALENTILVLTSDHGELFERGIFRHTTPVLYESITRVPLLISLPGQDSRTDTHTATSCIDILPTLLSLAGQPQAPYAEGAILPPFSSKPIDPERPIFTVEAKENSKRGRMTKGTISMVKGENKLIHYFGYDGYSEEFEQYNLAEDPEEMDDRYSHAGETSSDLRRELLQYLEDANKE